MTVAKPDFRPLETRGKAEVLAALAELTMRAEVGEIRAMAWVICTTDGVQQGHTVSDNALEMLGGMSRLQHWFNQSLDEEYGR